MLFTVDLEWPYHAIFPPCQWPLYWGSHVQGAVATSEVLNCLSRACITAVFYILGHVAEHQPWLVSKIKDHGHAIGSHGYWHQHAEHEQDDSDQLARRFLPSPLYGYRSPYWETTPWPGPSGGAWFRILPYPVLTRNLRKSGMFWIHPHDLYQTNLGPLRRRLFLCDPWQRLQRVLTDVKFDCP